LRTFYILLFLVCYSLNIQAQKRINGKLQILSCENAESLYDCSYNHLGTLFQKELSEETLKYFLYYKENPDTLKLGVQFIVNEEGKAERKLMNTNFNSLKRANDTIYNILKENVTFMMPLNECSKAVKKQTPRILLRYKVIISEDQKRSLELIPPLSKEERKNNTSKPADYRSAAPKFCKNEKSNKDLKACLSKFTKQHIAKNFKKKIIEEEGISCIYRLYAKVRINKKGKVDKVEVSENKYEKLEEEIIRVIESMPKVSPGTKNGEAVSVVYMIPIVVS